MINRRANSHEKNKSSIDFRTAQKTAYWRKNRNWTLLRLKIAQRTMLFQRSTAFLIKSLSVLSFLDMHFFIYFFIKCMQSMTMTLSRRCMYAKLHVIWSKSLLYIFSLINHIDSLRIQALFLNSHHRTFVFLCFFALFAFYSFVSNSHFLVVIRVFFKYFSVAILSILMMNSVNIVFVFLSWTFFLSFICSAL